MIKILAVLLLFAAPVRADEYYMTIYGAQTYPNIIRTSHTYATFEQWNGDNRKEHLCISWMPARLKVKSLFMVPEDGVNLSLEDTQAIYAKKHTTIYGPYKIKKELYDMAKRQHEFLNSGQHDYVCLDWIGRYRGVAINCTHAISDMDKSRHLRTYAARGDSAAKDIVLHFREFILEQSEPFRILIVSAMCQSNWRAK